ncbi:MAG TPA: YafY family protein [Herpetosiphonaceae bacterium]|nr:YafY family protein [Herpetosiphonaceae bacterium]
MYFPATRLLTILELLQAYPALSGAALARRLEVEPRTIRRYVLMLQDMGMPIESTRGPGGGYRLRPGFKLPPLMLTDDEATAITLALLGSAWLDIDLSGVAVTGALSKIMRVLPLAVRERVQAVAAHLVQSPPAPAARADATLVMTIGDAIQRGRRIALDYRSADGAQTERVVEPYGLAGWWGRWYLAAYCTSRRDYRLFRLDRIAGAEVGADPFAPDAGFDWQAFVAEQLARWSSAWSIEVEFQSDLEEAERRVPADYGTFAAAPAGVRFTFQHSDLPAAARFLIGLNLPFTVLRPPELRTELRQIAEQIIRSIGDSDGPAEA